MRSRALIRCPHCHAPAPRLPPRIVRNGVIAAAWVVSMIYLFIMSMLGPLAIAALPVLIFSGIAVVSAAYIWADGDLVCDKCGRLIMLDAEPVPPAEQPVEPAQALAA